MKGKVASEKIQWANSYRKESYTFYPIKRKRIAYKRELSTLSKGALVIEIDAYDSENQFVQKRKMKSIPLE
jgi:hypothetical protein